MHPSSTPRARRRARTGAAAAAALSLLGTAVAAPADASGDAAPGPGLSGWWYDALVVEEAHRETTGDGATVIMADGTIDADARELVGADLTLGKNCMGDPVESFTVPDAKHGTDMASLIVGTGKGTGADGAGIAGIAPDARLDYYSLDFDPERPGISCKSAILPHLREAVAAAEGGPIVSWSVGNLVIGMEEFQREVEEAGGVSVAAAGNRYESVKGQMDAPAGFPGYVGVLSLDRDAQPSEANPGPQKAVGKYFGYPSISAPGVDIPALGWRGGGWRSGVEASGTSYATALVAGALALVKSKYPDATGNQLIQHLIHFDTDPETFEYSDELGFGILSLRNMLANDPTGWPDVNPILGGHPKRVLERFPLSIYDPEGSADTAEADGSTVAGDDAAEAKAGAEESAEGTEPAAAEASSTSDGGLPTAVWVAAALVVLGLAGGAVAVARRSRASEQGRGGTS